MIPEGIVTMYGRPGTLKSSSAITWGLPNVTAEGAQHNPQDGRVLMFDFDMGIRRAWLSKQMQGTGQLTNKSWPIPPKSITTRYAKLEGFQESWQKFTQEYSEALENPAIFTVVIDTSTSMWMLCTDAYLQELQRLKADKKQLIQIEYREPNNRMKQVLGNSRVYKKHLVLAHHEGERLAPMMFNGQPILDENNQQKMVQTGDKEPDGFRYTVGLSDWVFHFMHEPKRKVAEGPKYFAVIEKSALGVDLVGMEFDLLKPNEAGNGVETLYHQLTKRLQFLGRI